jgi:hypothetical protein
MHREIKPEPPDPHGGIEQGVEVGPTTAKQGTDGTVPTEYAISKKKSILIQGAFVFKEQVWN